MSNSVRTNPRAPSAHLASRGFFLFLSARSSSSSSPRSSPRFSATRSQNAAEKLRNQVAPTATVLRDGKETEILRREIVPGDVIRLIAGDLVPADARLIQSRDVHVNQAALTGGSLPAEKDVNGADSSRNMVYLGTSVVSGTATALVIATGKNTQSEIIRQYA